MVKLLAGVRKAYKSLGDDVTLTRWVKTERGHSDRITKPMPADANRTRFLSRVIHPDQMKTLLVSGFLNVKIGRDVRKGRFRGYWIYTLSLEERATCPRSCYHWQTCYGGAMPFAKRIDHTAASFLPRLEREIDDLLAIKGRTGLLIRLHALGDFFSVAYVAFWARMLRTHDRLALFGYTAWPPESEIGTAIRELRFDHGPRAMIRHSDGGTSLMSTVSIRKTEDAPADAIVCPEQTGKQSCCARCGYCWTGTKNVAFVDHGA